jgi:hypothetical protein
MKVTPSMAKNSMARALEEILDRSPRNTTPVWTHFGNACAYCSTPLDRTARTGQMDHATRGEGNGLGNLVLACGPCNGDHKREMDWFTFLGMQPPGRARDRRERTIRSWLAMNRRVRPANAPEAEAVVASLEALIQEFGVECTRLRAAI